MRAETDFTPPNRNHKALIQIYRQPNSVSSMTWLKANTNAIVRLTAVDTNKREYRFKLLEDWTNF